MSPTSPDRSLVPDPASGLRETYREMQAGLGVIAAGTLATVVAFGVTEGLRLAMIATGVRSPSHDAWFVLSGLQQVGWQFLLACYGVLLVGSALLRASGREPTVRRWAGGGMACLALALASRAVLIGAAPNVRDFDWQSLVIRAASLAELWCLLGALLAVDMVIRRLAERLGRHMLSTASASHAVLVGCLGLAALVWELLGEPHDVSSSSRKAEALMRLWLGAICLAWTFRLTCDARRACLGIESDER